jgi:hypothetical protein
VVLMPKNSKGPYFLCVQDGCVIIRTEQERSRDILGRAGVISLQGFLHIQE